MTIDLGRATAALERYAEIQTWYRNTVADNEGKDLRPEDYEAYDDERLELLEEVIDILDQYVNRGLVEGRQKHAEAWDDGFEAGYDHARAVNPEWPEQPANPYR